MISRDPNVPYKGFVQDFDYGLNWRNFLAKLGLANEWEDWDEFVRDECAKLAEKEEKEMDAQWQKEKESQQAADGSDPDGDTPATAEVDPTSSSKEDGSEERTYQLPRNVIQSLDTEEDPSDTELDAVEDLIGVQVPIAGQQNDSPPSEEETKNQCKQRTVR